MPTDSVLTSPFMDSSKKTNTLKSVRKLQVDRILGTTSNSSFSVSANKSKVAYTAGAGAVVSEIGRDEAGQPYFVSQKYYCTSGRTINRILQEQSQLWGLTAFDSAGSSSLARDSYGYLIEGCAISPGGDSHDNRQAASTTLQSSATTSPVKERMKTSCAVDLSPDNRLLAIGESGGYQPRVFIYSTSESSANIPVAMISEHRFGVTAVKFSPCGKFLATLGTPNDGFLYIWSLSRLKENILILHSSNRSISVINDLTWLSNTSLLTVGVRQIRLWKLDLDQNSIILNGRNIILNKLSASSFVSCSRIADGLVVVISSTGEVCSMSDSSGLIQCHFSIDRQTTCVNYGANALWIGLADGRICSFDTLVNQHEVSIMVEKAKYEQYSNSNIVAICSTNSDEQCNYLLILDEEFSSMSISVWNKQVAEDTDVKGRGLLIKNPLNVFKGHNIVRTIKINNSCYCTLSSQGVVVMEDITSRQRKIYNLGMHMKQESTFSAMSQAGTELALGDSSGSVYFVRLDDESCLEAFDAHGSQVEYMSFCGEDNCEFLATCSRDRTIQLFKKRDSQWTLHQTLVNCHKSAIVEVRFSECGNTLLTLSNDRSLHIHRRVPAEGELFPFAFVSERTVSLKATPISFAVDQEQNIAISTTDKLVSIYSKTGNYLTSFRTNDATDSTYLSGLSMVIIHGKEYLAGIGSDKSLRLLEHPSGLPVATGWAHSESIIGVNSFQRDEEEVLLVSVGSDGCSFWWSLVGDDVLGPCRSRSSSFGKETKAAPVRKVVSQNELAKMRHMSSAGPRLPPPSMSPRPKSPTFNATISRCTSPTLKLTNKEGRSPSPIRSSSPITVHKNPRSTSPVRHGTTSVGRISAVSGAVSRGLRKVSNSRSFGDLKKMARSQQNETSSCNVDNLCRLLREYRDWYVTQGDSGDNVSRITGELRATLRTLGDRDIHNELDDLKLSMARLITMAEKQ